MKFGRAHQPKPNQEPMYRLRQTILALIILFAAGAAYAQTGPTDPSLFTLASIFTYRGQPLNALKWAADSKSYLVLEASGKGEAQDIVRYDAASGQKTV